MNTKFQSDFAALYKDQPDDKINKIERWTILDFCYLAAVWITWIYLWMIFFLIYYYFHSYFETELLTDLNLIANSWIAMHITKKTD